MKKIHFDSLHLIDKLVTLRQAAKNIEREYNENEKRFKILVDDIDNGYIDDNPTFEEKIIQLNIILSKSDDLLQQIEIVNELVNEARAQLSN